MWYHNLSLIFCATGFYASEWIVFKNFNHRDEPGIRGDSDYGSGGFIQIDENIFPVR
jgi:hypothetical protein